MTPKQRRTEIKRILHLLSEENRDVFARMYSHENIDRPIDEIVDTMPAKQLKWALSQCETSYHRIWKVLQR